MKLLELKFEPANDNIERYSWKHLRFQSGGDWHLYGRIDITIWGPIGVFGNGDFVYLDPEIAAWRS